MDQTTKDQTTNPSSGRNNNVIVYWVIILVLLIGGGYLLMSKNEMAVNYDKTSKVAQTQIDSVKTSRAALQTDFDAASSKIDQLVTQNSRMDSTLQRKKGEMAKLQGRIRTILSDKNATERDLKEAKEMIATLTDKTTEYEARIAMLEKENSTLTSSNLVLTKEVDSTVTANVSLKKVGSVLHASNLRLEPIKEKRNGKEKETVRAKRVDKLRILFDIDENRIAESGNKQVYLRIIGPDGNVLSSKSATPTTITADNGTPITYSTEKDITLVQNQVVKDVSVDWKQDNDYPHGNYTVEIYNDGYKVGSGSIALK